MFLVGGIYLDAFQVPEVGVILHLHLRSDGTLLDTTITLVDGKFAFTGIPTDGLVYIMAVKSGKQALVFDSVRPSSEYILTTDNIRTTNLCDPIGLVGPAVISGQFTGHTVSWTQLTGLPVTLTGGTTLSPTFINSPIGLTRTWLLTIDAGTCFEVTQEYEVSGRPAEVASWPTQTLERRYSPPSRSVTSRGSKITGEVRRVRVEPKVITFGTPGPIPPDCTPIAEWQLLWDRPAAFDDPVEIVNKVAGRFLRYEVEEYVAGWNVVKTLNDGDSLFHTVVAGKPYRVVTVWVRGQGIAPWPLPPTRIQTGAEFRVVSKAAVVPDSRADTLFAGAVSWHKIWNSMFSNIKNFVVDIPTRITKAEESIANWPSQALIEKSRVDITSSLIEIGLDGLTGNDAFWPVQALTLKSFQITRSNGSSIGS